MPTFNGTEPDRKLLNLHQHRQYANTRAAKHQLLAAEFKLY